MSGYIDKVLADAMEVLSDYCKSRLCSNCCFYTGNRCYLHCTDPEKWKTETVIVPTPQYKLKEEE